MLCIYLQFVRFRTPPLPLPAPLVLPANPARLSTFLWLNSTWIWDLSVRNIIANANNNDILIFDIFVWCCKFDKSTLSVCVSATLACSPAPPATHSCFAYLFLSTCQRTKRRRSQWDDNGTWYSLQHSIDLFLSTWATQDVAILLQCLSLYAHTHTPTNKHTLTVYQHWHFLDVG